MSDMDNAEKARRRELLAILNRVLTYVSTSEYTTDELECLVEILEPVGERCLTEFEEGEPEDEPEDLN